MNPHDAIDTLESAIGDPRHGLPEEIFLFLSRIIPMANVDLLIQDQLPAAPSSLGATTSSLDPGWHVPGGIPRYKEMAADRIRAWVTQELGAEVAPLKPSPSSCPKISASRPAAGTPFPLLYGCTLLTPPDESCRAHSNPPRHGEWRWHEFCPPDLLDIQAAFRPFF